MLHSTASTTTLRFAFILSMQMSKKPALYAKSKIHWILDWDGTITQQDTLNTLVSIAASTKPAFPTSERWSQVTKAYLQEYTEALEEHTTCAKLPATIRGQKELLHQLKPVEQKSLTRVSHSGIFTGLTRVQLEQGARTAIQARHIEIRNGFEHFFQIIQNRMSQGDSFTILSVNWSRHFLASCLAASGFTVPLSSILCNELQGLSQDIPSSGHIIPSIISSGDKFQELERLRKGNFSLDDNHAVVYIGDSWTDIEALLAADLGICIRSDPIGSSQQQLADALERLSIICPHLSNQSECDRWSVVWVRDFEEIRAWAEP